HRSRCAGDLAGRKNLSPSCPLDHDEPRTCVGTRDRRSAARACRSALLRCRDQPGMKVLITRAEEEARRLAARGIDSLIEPLIAVRFRPESAAGLAPFLDGVQAAIFTSANGARAFAAATARRDLRVFAVGPATAMAAREAGFGQ